MKVFDESIFYFFNLLGLCPYIAGVYNDGIIRLDKDNSFNGNFKPASGKVIPFNGTVDSTCKGEVINLKDDSIRGFTYFKEVCKINWDSGKVSTKAHCV